jgi:AcrR family transcriptional regulator
MATRKKPTRRIGAEDSATRAALVDAAHRLMISDGYAAVTSRRVAAEAGLKPQLVHYYFRTMDDLFVEMVRRGAERNLERLDRALASPQPLRALWDLYNDRTTTAATMEFSALANHREAVRTEFENYAARFRRVESEAIARIVDGRPNAFGLTPDGIAVYLSSTARFMAYEEALGLTAGHDDLRARIDRDLAAYDAAG